MSIFIPSPLAPLFQFSKWGTTKSVLSEGGEWCIGIFFSFAQVWLLHGCDTCASHMVPHYKGLDIDSSNNSRWRKDKIYFYKCKKFQMCKMVVLTKYVLVGCCVSSFSPLKSRIKLVRIRAVNLHDITIHTHTHMTRTNFASRDLYGSLGHLIAKSWQEWLVFS